VLPNLCVVQLKISLGDSHNIISPLNTYIFSVLISNDKILQNLPSAAFPAGLELPAQLDGLPNVTPGWDLGVGGTWKGSTVFHSLSICAFLAENCTLHTMIFN
jgi:hypothetical protein